MQAVPCIGTALSARRPAACRAADPASPTTNRTICCGAIPSGGKREVFPRPNELFSVSIDFGVKNIDFCARLTIKDLTITSCVYGVVDLRLLPTFEFDHKLAGTSCQQRSTHAASLISIGGKWNNLRPRRCVLDCVEIDGRAGFA